jgi:hypothetical protein
LRRTVLGSLGVTLFAVIAMTGAVLLAEHGASRWWFGLLLGVPLTLGLPTTLGVLLCISCWSGSALWLFAALASLTGFVFQVGAALLVRRLVRGRRS